MFANTRAAIALFNAGQILPNPRRLNPLHLSIAQRAYVTQSQTFGLPDRWGMFSPGPPRLQVYEADRFVYAVLAWLFLATWALAFWIWYWWMGLRNPVSIALLCAGSMVGMVMFIWVTGCRRDGKRAPGYVWKDWERGEVNQDIGEVEQGMRGLIKNLVVTAVAYMVVEGLRIWVVRKGGLLGGTAY
ncbi:hypothetical protein P171DRAFT_448618 [Karstenula rhodostoma CBS 690.94]|uniref:Uncharacterized protein n=1 Tax=Karstenula rhodostoma CBS 690.94 TaxID=1392251 RepID=A0A9P4P833_9PLEO|nr:hypothetical protein P171DRAFT_448618 [Karstenula rhodostoma CBS 690.94]